MERYIKLHDKQKYRKSLYYKGLIALGLAVVVFICALTFGLIYFVRYKLIVVPSITVACATQLSTNKKTNNDGDVISASSESAVLYEFDENENGERFSTSTINVSDNSKIYIVSPYVSANYFKKPVYIRAKINYYENNKLIDNSKVVSSLLGRVDISYWRIDKDYVYLIKYDGQADEYALNMQNITKQVMLFDKYRVPINNPANDSDIEYKITVTFEYTTDLNLWRVD